MKTAQEILTSCDKFRINLGLERIEKVLSLLNHPEKSFKIIHIAGTNGKGSTAKIINEILIEKFTEKGIGIGLFTSPHLFSYTERIKINNENIPQYIFDKLTNKINEFAISADIELTEFELITAVAFYYFYIKKVQYVILEVGLGGKYDATNVIENPLVEAITTIDFDHTERLGKTIDEIALQKAGIIKKNSKVAISPLNKGFNAVQQKIKEQNATLIDIPEVKILFENGKNFAIFKDKKFEFNLLGEHQAQNLALALGVVFNLDIDIDENILKNALKKVSWRFRLEYHPEKNILIDGAHNPSGTATLKNFLDNNFKNDKKTIIFGCLKNKDFKTMLEILKDSFDEFYFYEFDYPNALSFSELDSDFQKKFKKIKTIEEIEKIIKEKENLKIFTGSFYMLGQIFSKINI